MPGEAGFAGRATHFSQMPLTSLLSAWWHPTSCLQSGQGLPLHPAPGQQLQKSRALRISYQIGGATRGMSACIILGIALQNADSS